METVAPELISRTTTIRPAAARAVQMSPEKETKHARPSFASPYLMRFANSGIAARKEGGDSRTVHEIAASGFSGAGKPLPYLNQIQSSFGHHDITEARAYFGPEASVASRRLGAEAYTYGDRVAFAGSPNLHIAAHEAAHVVQQRAGVHLKNNVSEPGDAYERQADAVAALVVQGRRSQPLLDQVGVASREGPMQKAVQMVPTPTDPVNSLMPRKIIGFQEMFTKYLSINEIKAPIAEALAKEYVNRPGRIELPDRVVRDTPYGGDKVIPGFHEPTEDVVYNALLPVIDLKKTGKGAKDWSWEWHDESAPGKTSVEKRGEIGKFAVEQAISRTFKRGQPFVDIGVIAAEYGLTGKLSGTAVIEAVSAPVAKWIMRKALRIGARVVVRAIPIIGWLFTIYDIADLLISLGEPSEKEVSAYQMKNANIVARVRAYWQGKKEAVDLQEALKKPFDPRQYLKPIRSDKTIVRPH